MSICPHRRAGVALLLALSLGACNAFQPLDKKIISDDENVRAKALKAVAQLSADGQQRLIPALVESLHNPESIVVDRAAEALAVIGRPAVNDLRKMLKDPDVYARVSAASVLGKLGPDARPAIPDLVACLSDPHPLVREEAAFSLGQMGQSAIEAGPPLLEALKDPNLEVRTASFEALKKIGITPPRFS